MRINVVDTSNKPVGQMDIDDSVFAGPVKNALFYDVVKMQLANRRRGTAKAKRIDEVSGTGKKPYKQKGTGRARHGNMRSVGMVKGAAAHGPEPRDHSYSMPKKMIEGALRSAISLRTGEKAMFVYSGWAPKAPKTKDAAKVVENFGGKSALVVGDKNDLNLARSLKNLPHAKFLPVDALNVYDILNHDHLMFSDKVIPALEARLKKAKPSRKEKELADAKRA
ncbi:MAG: 50S ribosomal protein L4 [Myxococcota bacterium]